MGRLNNLVDDSMRYRTRAIAKKQIKLRFTGQKMQAYDCGGYWHIGHPLTLVSGGYATREQMRSVNGRRRA